MESEVEILSDRIEGELAVSVRKEVRQRAEEAYRWAVVLRLSTEKAFNAPALMDAMTAAWKMKNCPLYREMFGNRIVVKLRNEEEQNRILEGGPWTFMGWAVLVEKWIQGKTPLDYISMKLRIWIQIHNFPMELREGSAPCELAELAGRVVKDELQDNNKVVQRRRCDRFRIEIDVDKPIMRGVYLKETNMEYTWIDFKYERLPNLCCKCGRMNHETGQCDYVQGEELTTRKFGPWLKADNTKSGREVAEYAGESYRMEKASGRGGERDVICTKGGEEQVSKLGSRGMVVQGAENMVEEQLTEVGGQRATRRQVFSDCGCQDIGAVTHAFEKHASYDCKQQDVGVVSQVHGTHGFRDVDQQRVGAVTYANVNSVGSSMEAFSANDDALVEVKVAEGSWRDKGKKVVNDTCGQRFDGLYNQAKEQEELGVGQLFGLVAQQRMKNQKFPKLNKTCSVRKALSCGMKRKKKEVNWTTGLKYLEGDDLRSGVEYRSVGDETEMRDVAAVDFEETAEVGSRPRREQ
ncbi:unnamed protein product [Rhodiola kirilowii]